LGPAGTVADATAPVLRRSWEWCGLGSLLLVRDGLLSSRPLLCHSWACDTCRAAIVRRWCETLERSRKQGTFLPRVFLTVTMSPACLARDGVGLTDWAAQRDWFQRKLTALWRRARRAFGRLSYWRVYEWHRGLWNPDWRVHNHRLHLHAIVDSDAPGGGFGPAARRLDGLLPRYERDLDWWARTCEELGIGLAKAYTLDDSQGLAAMRYCAKYASKKKHDGNGVRIRLASCSQDIRHAPRPSTVEDGDRWGVVTVHDARISIFAELERRAAVLGVSLRPGGREGKAGGESGAPPKDFGVGVTCSSHVKIRRASVCADRAFNLGLAPLWTVNECPECWAERERARRAFLACWDDAN